MSSLKTLVLLFSLLLSTAFSVSLANGLTGPATCEIFYEDASLRSPKHYIPAPEIAPLVDLWKDVYEPAHANTPNRILSNKDTRNIDQCSSRECFLFAYLGALETTHKNRSRTGREIHFSAAYLVAKKFEHVIGEILSNNQNGQGMYFNLKGGETYHALKLAQTYGLVPEEIWKPVVRDLKDWDFPKIYADIIARVDEIIEKRNSDPNAYPASENQRLTQEIFNAVLGPYVGQWPKPFWYDGIYHTPESFGRLYNFDSNGNLEIQHLNGNGPYMNSAQNHNLPFFLRPLFKNGGYKSYHRADTSQMLFKSVENALSADKAVLLDVDGSDAAESGVGHQMVITNVEVKPDNSVRSLRLKNSYTNWGNNGYRWYSTDAVAKKLRRVWIFDVNKDIPDPKPNPPQN